MDNKEQYASDAITASMLSLDQNYNQILGLAPKKWSVPIWLSRKISHHMIFVTLEAAVISSFSTKTSESGASKKARAEQKRIQGTLDNNLYQTNFFNYPEPISACAAVTLTHSTHDPCHTRNLSRLRILNYNPWVCFLKQRNDQQRNASG